MLYATSYSAAAALPIREDRVIPRTLHCFEKAARNNMRVYELISFLIAKTSPHARLRPGY
jgi:hypothetical protein